MKLYLCSGEQYSEPITAEECLACAKRLRTPPCGYTYPLLKAMLLSNEDRSSSIHVTDVVGCLRKAYFYKKNNVPDYVHNYLAVFIGKAVHAYIEQFTDEQGSSEVKVSHGDVVGSADYVTEDTVYDFKTTQKIIPKYLPYGKHLEQVSAYASILQKQKGIICYISTSGPSKCPECNKGLRYINGKATCVYCNYIDPQGHVGAYSI
ncbi:MAG: hypothetical protein QXS54_11245, partial [Candidatus Methanomethylicaceae archaeon]